MKSFSRYFVKIQYRANLFQIGDDPNVKQMAGMSEIRPLIILQICWSTEMHRNVGKSPSVEIQRGLFKFSLLKMHIIRGTRK